MRTLEDRHRRYAHQAGWTGSIRKYLLAKAVLSKDAKILEVGCGTGAILSELRHHEHVYGLDLDYPSVSFASKHGPPANLICADAHRLPFSTATFDLLLCHFLLLWVGDPAEVIREMSRVGRPGTAVIALAEPDYGGRIDHPGELEELGNAQTASLTQQGADATMGRRLGEIFASAGLEEIEVGILGAQWTGPLSKQDFASEWDVITTDLADDYSHEQLIKFKQRDRSAWDLRQRILYVPTFYAYGKIGLR